jgi:hypothetical protein
MKPSKLLKIVVVTAATFGRRIHHDGLGGPSYVCVESAIATREWCSLVASIVAVSAVDDNASWRMSLMNV